MTDVVTHADPTPPGEGRRSTRRHRNLGLRVPHGDPADTPTAAIPADAGPRHRRAPGTAPIVVPAAPETSRHRAAHPGEAFDPTTGSIPTSVPASIPTVVSPPTPPSAGRRAAHRPGARAADPGATVAGVTAAAATSAATPTATGAHRGGAQHGAGAPRRTVPLRATIGLLGVGGVAAVFALTTPGTPAPTAAPAEAPPQLAAPAGLASPMLPGPPAQADLVPLPAAPPVVSTTPTSEEPQPVIGALFDAASGAFSELFDNNGREGLVENAQKPRIVENPDAPGRDAWQFSLAGGGKRSEVLPEGPGTRPRVGDEQFIRYTAQLSDDFPTDTSSWQVILQWHHTSPNGSPPLALQVTQGQLMMVSNGDDMQPIGPVSPGDRIDLTMNVVFSDDPGESSVTVWRDGRPTGVTDWSPREGTMSTEAAYLKMGMYRDTGIRQPGSVLVTDLKIGRDAAGIGGIGPRPVD